MSNQSTSTQAALGNEEDEERLLWSVSLTIGDTERFNGMLHHEVLNAEWFHSIKQARVVINLWLKEYNHIRPHHALGIRPPAPETLLEKPKISGTEIGRWTLPRMQAFEQ